MITTFLDNWILKPEYVAAWLQAATAIIALCISVWAVWWTGAVARRRDRLEIRGIAVAVFPEIEMLKINIQNVRDGLAFLKQRDGGLVGQSVAANLQLTAHIPIPPMMDRNIDKLFILGDIAGPSCLHLVRLLLQYNATVSSISSHLVALNAEQWVEAAGHLENHLTLLEKVIEKCEHEVRRIHDFIEG
jgi:hypothetical protein